MTKQTTTKQTIAEVMDYIAKECGGGTIKRVNTTGRKVRQNGYLSVWEENNFEVESFYFDADSGKWVICF